jgi:hypothetical protein
VILSDIMNIARHHHHLFLSASNPTNCDPGLMISLDAFCPRVLPIVVLVCTTFYRIFTLLVLAVGPHYTRQSYQLAVQNRGCLVSAAFTVGWFRVYIIWCTDEYGQYEWNKCRAKECRENTCRASTDRVNVFKWPNAR